MSGPNLSNQGSLTNVARLFLKFVAIGIGPLMRNAWRSCRGPSES